ncbi:MAG: Eco57I restriction-modification methylase domain-containing protein [Endomicrobium sp.]|jgi:adenine-specific DNA-methyltransferase|nr:Eco57I restriction-modification methylase domain-containing protein [Endomicrobium sp.]
MIKTVENIKTERVNSMSAAHKNEYGQFLTPVSIACFMASLFSDVEKDVKLLDAGAGTGILSASFIEKHFNNSRRILVTAYEIDRTIINMLEESLSLYKYYPYNVSYKIINDDFILSEVEKIIKNKNNVFTHAIMNPPYKKLSVNSNHRKFLSLLKVNVVNFYAAFMALALLLLKENGELAAIVPRSFCNGTYYNCFRHFINNKANINHIHLFKSRTGNFKDEDVLQENIIIYLTKTKERRKMIKISHSSDSTFADYKEEEYKYDDIINRESFELFINIPEDKNNIGFFNEKSACKYTLHELGIDLSTGPVIEFRMKKFLKKNPCDKYVPILYPEHFNCGFKWPSDNLKRFNCIENNEITKKLFYKNGIYPVVNRFSPKEASKRIISNLYLPFNPKCKYVAFENHLNVFHKNKSGLDLEIAKGLMIFLNSSFVDKMFRLFNGHTQVNAGDLKALRYPSESILREIGKWGIKNKDNLSQELIDIKIKRHI